MRGVAGRQAMGSTQQSIAESKFTDGIVLSDCDKRACVKGGAEERRRVVRGVPGRMHRYAERYHRQNRCTNPPTGCPGDVP